MGFVNYRPWQEQPWNDEDNDSSVLGPWNFVEWGEPRFIDGEWERLANGNLSYDYRPYYDDPPPPVLDKAETFIYHRYSAGTDCFVTANRVYFTRILYYLYFHEYNGAFSIGYTPGTSTIDDNGVITGDWTLHDSPYGESVDVRGVAYSGKYFLTLNKIHKFKRFNQSVVRDSGVVEFSSGFNKREPPLPSDFNGNILLTRSLLYSIGATESNPNNITAYHCPISCDGTVVPGGWTEQSDVIPNFPVDFFQRVTNHSGGNDRFYAFFVAVPDETNPKRCELRFAYSEIDSETGHLGPWAPDGELQSWDAEHTFEFTRQEYAVGVNATPVYWKDDLYLKHNAFSGSINTCLVMTKARIYIFLETAYIVDSFGESIMEYDGTESVFSVIILGINQDASLRFIGYHENLFNFSSVLKPVITKSRLYFLAGGSGMYCKYRKSTNMAGTTYYLPRFYSRDVPNIFALWIPFSGGKNNYLDSTYDDDKAGCVADARAFRLPRLRVSGDISVKGGGSPHVTPVVARGLFRMPTTFTVRGGLSVRQSPQPARVRASGMFNPPRLTVRGGLSVRQSPQPVALRAAGMFIPHRLTVRGRMRARRSLRLGGRYTLRARLGIRGVCVADDDWILRFKREEVL